MMWLRINALMACLVLSGLCIGSVLADAPKEPRVNDPAAGTIERASDSARQMSDRMMANCVSIENQEEVAFAKYAEGKTTNSSVREFANQLVRDHQAFLKKLDRFYPEASREVITGVAGTASDNDPANPPIRSGAQAERPAVQPDRTVASTPVAPGATQGTGGPNAAGLDMVALHRELAAQCLADSKKMLSEKSAEEFDACFVGMQIAKHAAMATKLKVLQRHTSSELSQLLKEGQATTERHMAHAEKLMKDLPHHDRKTAKAAAND